MPDLILRCIGGMLIPFHVLGTSMSYARSDCNSSVMAGQAVRIAGVTCVARSVM